MYAILYFKDTKKIIWAGKDVEVKEKYLKGDIGTIAGWDNNIDYILLKNEPPEYKTYVKNQDALKRIYKGEKLGYPAILVLSSKTLLAPKAKKPKSLEDRVKVLEEKIKIK